MRRIAVALTCAGIAAAAVGCGSSDDGGSTGSATSGSSGKTEKVDFRLNWVIAGNHAPFYLAKEKGYWSDCGLDVSMEAGKGSGDTAQLVATGSQQFGLTDAVSVVAGRSQGLPIKSLGVIYQTNPSSFVSKKDENITSVQDVAGKTFGAVPGGSPYLLAQALFKQNNVKPGKEVSIPAPGIAQLKTGQVDFITFFGNEVANIDPDWQQNLNVVPFKDAGQDIYGLTIATSDDYAKSHPEQVKCFREGVIKGFQEAKKDPQAAVDALYAAEPTTKESPDVQEQLLDGAFEYTGDDLLAENAQRWQQTEKVLVDAGIAKKQVPVDEIMLPQDGQ
jgi:ABC-type nitrate/sulfonate/bicarbonate transport system substrate-binding protein